MTLLTRIRRHERGLHFRYGDFRGLVAPGAMRVWSRLFGLERDRIEVKNTLDTELVHPLLKVIVRDPSARKALLVVDLKDGERGILRKDGRVAALLGPGLRTFWKEPAVVSVEVFQIAEGRFVHADLEAILALPDAARFLNVVIVQPTEEILLYKNGALFDRLGPGKYAFWEGAGRFLAEKIDLREQVTDVAGQEILTKDKVTLRLNLVVSWKVNDAHLSVTKVTSAKDAIYRDAQLLLRAAVSTRTLDALLAEKEAVGREIESELSSKASEFGVEVRSVGVKDVILPGEMRTILNQVITAEKEAEANLIRRREETAAARSQANTARLLAENPILARMKELELLQQVLAGTKATFVLGQGPLTDQIRSLFAQDSSTPSG